MLYCYVARHADQDTDGTTLEAFTLEVACADLQTTSSQSVETASGMSDMTFSLETGWARVTWFERRMLYTGACCILTRIYPSDG